MQCGDKLYMDIDGWIIMMLWLYSYGVDNSMIDNEKIMESINGVKDDIFKILNNLQQQLDDIKQQQNKEEPVVDDRSNEDVISSEEAWESLFK